MAKQRKTRQEKIVADLRHKLYAVKNQNFSLQTPLAKPINVYEQPIRQYSYPYLKQDVFKTLILTLTIIVFQIILLFIFKKHLISLPGLRY